MGRAGVIFRATAFSKECDFAPSEATLHPSLEETFGSRFLSRDFFDHWYYLHSDFLGQWSCMKVGETKELVVRAASESALSRFSGGLPGWTFSSREVKSVGHMEESSNGLSG